MVSLFVSHSGEDRTVALMLHEQLRLAGFEGLFLDFDPERGIPAGRNWERELYSQLKKTDGLVFLASSHSVASQWCFAEISLARSFGRPVFPIRLQSGVDLPLLDDVQWVDMIDGDMDLLRLLTGLRAAGLHPEDSFAWDSARSPYPGMMPFAVEDAAVFFGRDAEARRLVELLQPTPLRRSGRFVAIVGPSGSGKSSLLRAGLLPRLARSPEQWVLLPSLIPVLHSQFRW